MRIATPVSLTEPERHNLEQLRRGRRIAVRLAERAAIVLLADDGLENQQIAAELGISRHKAGRWRDRYARLGLAGIEKDAPRPGRHRRINDAQRAEVVRMTLHEKPEGQTHWSRSTMAAASGVSDSTVGRIWREHGLKRGSFYNVDDLTGAIQEYINQYNEAPRPFVWTASATDILAKVKRARAVLNKA